jgi:hypothetical protein
MVEKDDPRRAAVSAAAAVSTAPEVDSQTANYDELKSALGTENQAVNEAEIEAENGSYQTDNQTELPFENGLNRERVEAEATPTTDDNQSKSASSEPENGSLLEADDETIENNYVSRKKLKRAAAISGHRREIASKADGFFNSE